MRKTLALMACLACAMPALAQEVTIAANDNAPTFIAAQKGKRITLRLRSGHEMAGTVRDANGALVVLGVIAGREFFDAVVPIEAVEAVLIRTKRE